MRHVLLASYVLLFSTGFMGGAALFVFRLRVRSRVLGPLFVFQTMFLAGLGLVGSYYYLHDVLGIVSSPWLTAAAFAASGINAALYIIAFVLIRRLSPSRRRGFPAAAELLAALVVLKTFVTIALETASAFGRPNPVSGSAAWSLGGYILTGIALAVFGAVLRGPVPAGEPQAVRPLLRAYGLCAIAFAPAGILEYAVAEAGIAGLSFVSLDHLFFLAWNIVSMSAAVRLFGPESGRAGTGYEPAAERVLALGLSPREVEMARAIGRGLSNKEIASELSISPATVRTHIYNLYRKAGARSRVELLNRLRA